MSGTNGESGLQPVAGLPHPLILLRTLVAVPEMKSAWAALGVIMHNAALPASATRCLARAHLIDRSDDGIALTLAGACLAAAQPEAALAALDAVSSACARFHAAQMRRAMALLALARHGEAADVVSDLLKYSGDDADLHSLMAEALTGLDRPGDARRHQIEAMRLRGGVLEIKATGPAEARILFLCSAHGADLPIDYLFDGARFDMVFIYPALMGPEAPLPACDLVFNAVADPDVGVADFKAVTALAGRIHVPLLNAPDNLPRTRRDLAGELTAGIDGLLVPKSTRLSSDELLRVARIDGPKLVRTAGTHGGDALDRVETVEEIQQFVRANPADFYYLTDYVDYRSADGWFRKYRFIFINRRPHPFHLAIMDHWKIHYWRAGMVVDPWRCAEEEAFMRRSPDAFPPSARACVERIGQALDLDYAGLDCGLMPDGRVVLFEANAAMLVHLNDNPDHYPYKHDLVPRIRDAMSGYMMERCGRPASP